MGWTLPVLVLASAGMLRSLVSAFIMQRHTAAKRPLHIAYLRDHLRDLDLYMWPVMSALWPKRGWLAPLFSTVQHRHNDCALCCPRGIPLHGLVSCGQDEHINCSNTHT